jgi:uncharacterized protein (DUF4415 family)
MFLANNGKTLQAFFREQDYSLSYLKTRSYGVRKKLALLAATLALDTDVAKEFRVGGKFWNPPRGLKV